MVISDGTLQTQHTWRQHRLAPPRAPSLQGESAGPERPVRRPEAPLQPVHRACRAALAQPTAGARRQALAQPRSAGRAAVTGAGRAALACAQDRFSANRQFF